MQNKIKQSETRVLKRSEITPSDYNPRTISDEARKALKKNIKENGLLGGIVVNERTGNIVSGHQRISIADEVNKFNPETKENDYSIKVEVINVDDKKEKELNIFMNSRSTQGEYDYKKLAQIFPDIDADLAGLDEVDLSMIEIELPDVPEVEIPSFEPQKEKAEKAMIEKSVTEELNNTVYHNSDGIHDMEKKESEEMSAEEKKALVKAIKEKVKEGATIQGDPYFTVSFDSYDAKVEFLEFLGFNPEDKFIKGEELQEKTAEAYASE
ncbi:MAG TPA: DNA methylase [Flavobacteriaceae bacterium]|nr:DNA methylase [Flavobacteriaceae bacterium]